MVIATNLASVCCVYKEKIVENYSYKELIKIQRVAIFDWDRNKKNLFHTNHSDFTTNNNRFFSAHSYRVDICFINNSLKTTIF